jgi:phage gpG-like protein
MSVSVYDDGLNAALNGALKALRDTSPVMRAVGRTIESNVHVRFDTKTAPDGSAWKPWATSTAKARAKEGRGTLLEYTGRMRASLAMTSDRKSATVAFGVPYASFVEKVRPVLLDGDHLGAEDEADVIAAAMKALKRQLRLESA